ncbi:MAG: hypothetical protein HY396_02035 [Candidatus Doudnabacteria bacterium]|nr:hypothetical protein [Candidatus Doudnabacteria bacterium]
MRIFWGLIGIIIGTLILKYTYPLVNFFGKPDWAEKYFSGGLGGTYFLFRLIGLAVIFFSALYMVGLMDNLFSPLANVFGGLGKQ